MSHSHIWQSLHGIYRLFSGVLEPCSQSVLADAASQVQESYSRFTQCRGKTHHVGAGQLQWGFAITPENPLRFARADHIRGLCPEADLYGRMSWSSASDWPDDACFVLRMWSGSESYIFRKAWDAADVQDILTRPGRTVSATPPRRVLLRLHFDLRTEGAPDSEPVYHLHVGGQAQEDELCWYPSGIDNPRIPYFPIDIVMACNIVISDFHTVDYFDISKKPEWRYLLKESQSRFLRPYLEKCLKAIDKDEPWWIHADRDEHGFCGR